MTTILGTRLLFDQLLASNGIDEASINGAQQMEFTHAAVAAYVASDMADASFGVEAAARQFNLDFIRLLTEDYFFVCRRAFLETEPMQRVLDVMKGREFHKAVAALPGYVAASTGSVSTVAEFLDSVDAKPAVSRQAEALMTNLNPASSAASRSASAMSSMVLALKNGSSGVVGHVTVASL